MEWLDVAFVCRWDYADYCTALESEDSDMHIQAYKNYFHITLDKFKARYPAFNSDSELELP